MVTGGTPLIWESSLWFSLFLRFFWYLWKMEVLVSGHYTLRAVYRLPFSPFSVFYMHFSGPTIRLCLMEWSSPHSIVLGPHYPKQRMESNWDNRFLTSEMKCHLYRYTCPMSYRCTYVNTERGPAKMQICSGSHSPNQNVFQNPLLNICGAQTRFSDENLHCQSPLVSCCSNIRKSRVFRKLTSTAMPGDFWVRLPFPIPYSKNVSDEKEWQQLFWQPQGISWHKYFGTPWCEVSVRTGILFCQALLLRAVPLAHAPWAKRPHSSCRDERQEGFGSGPKNPHLGGPSLLSFAQISGNKSGCHWLQVIIYSLLS